MKRHPVVREAAVANMVLGTDPLAYGDASIDARMFVQAVAELRTKWQQQFLREFVDAMSISIANRVWSAVRRG